MVHNTNEILDEGIIKYIEHYKMPNRKPMSFVRRYEADYIDSLDLKEKMTHILEVDTKGLTLEEWCMNYYGQEKFNECWMLNISPDWKGKTIDRHMFKQFCKVMDLFHSNTRRFLSMDYVLECGGEGNFLHCHAVFKLNLKKPGNIKSLRKGNFLKEFRSCWDRCDPRYKGLVKNRVALQTTFITNEEMLKDKIDYLTEELKPESHKNAVHEFFPHRFSC